MSSELVDFDALEAEAASAHAPPAAPIATPLVENTASPATLTTAAAVPVATPSNVDVEIEEMKRRVQEMEEEAEKLNEMQSQVEKQMGSTATSASDGMGAGAGHAAAGPEAAAVDEVSIYLGQVDYDATPEELQALFQSCGTINRVTIMCDKFTGQPKGFGYIEFASPEAVESALLLNDTTFRGRQLKVTPKRQNIKGFNRGRGRGGRGGGRFGRGRGRGGRGRGRGGYHPYY